MQAGILSGTPLPRLEKFLPHSQHLNITRFFIHHSWVSFTTHPTAFASSTCNPKSPLQTPETYLIFFEHTFLFIKLRLNFWWY